MSLTKESRKQATVSLVADILQSCQYFEYDKETFEKVSPGLHDRLTIMKDWAFVNSTGSPADISDVICVVEEAVARCGAFSLDDIKGISGS